MSDLGDVEGKLASRVTTRHEASKFGRPVILDEYGRLVDDREGLRRFMVTRDYTPEEFAEMLDVSARAVRYWLKGERKV